MATGQTGQGRDQLAIDRQYEGVPQRDGAIVVQASSGRIGFQEGLFRPAEDASEQSTSLVTHLVRGERTGGIILLSPAFQVFGSGGEFLGRSHTGSTYSLA